MILFILISILLISLFIFLQIIIYRSLVKKAIKKYIEPQLNEKGYAFIEYKWPGFLSSGDFNDLEVTLVTNKYGNSSNDCYADIYYQAERNIKKVTAKIESTFLSIKKVSYSSEL